jgi:hypothetical protein
LDLRVIHAVEPLTPKGRKRIEWKSKYRAGWLQVDDTAVVRENAWTLKFRPKATGFSEERAVRAGAI